MKGGIIFKMSNSQMPIVSTVYSSPYGDPQRRSVVIPFRFIVNNDGRMRYNGHYTVDEIVYTKAGSNAPINSFVSDTRFVITDMHLLIRDYPDLDSLRLTYLIKQITDTCYMYTTTHPGVARLAPTPIDIRVVIPKSPDSCVFLQSISIQLTRQNIAHRYVDLDWRISSKHLNQTIVKVDNIVYTYTENFQIDMGNDGEFRRIIWPENGTLATLLAPNDVIDIWFASAV